MAQSIVFTIQKATLISNVAYFQVDACPALEIGGAVVVSGCTTGTFNTSLTVLACGTFPIPNNIADTNGGTQLWTGFSASLSHANIAIEIEPTQPTDGAEGSPSGTAIGTVTQ